MFRSARIKLAVWYSLIIILISGSLSTFFYFRTAEVLDREFEAIRARIHQEQGKRFPKISPYLDIFPEEIAIAKRKIATQLLLVNGGIFVLFAGAGYFLSGKTLRPIQHSMDAQKRFIGDAAHELKTPITALKTSIEVNLMDEKIANETRQVLEENLEDVNSLQVLTEGLLALTQHEELNFSFSSVNLQDLLEKVVNNMQPLAEEKSMHLILAKDEEHTTLQGDSVSLARLFTIFVDNAIKYSDRDTQVVISIERQRNTTEVVVQDHGHGIAKHHLPHVSARFYRVDTSRSSSGHGLGLSLAKKIVDQHNAVMSIASEVGKGTKVTVIFNRVS